MIEMRWVWHDLNKSAPPQGSLAVDIRLYQKLQYRQLIEPSNSAAKGTPPEWSEWIDVPHSGVVV